MRTTRSDLFATIAGSWIPKTVLASFALCLLITAAIAIAQNVYVWTANVPPQGLATIDAGRLGMVVGTSGIATAFLTAFLVTLFGAERNYRRSREPHSPPHPDPHRHPHALQPFPRRRGTHPPRQKHRYGTLQDKSYPLVRFRTVPLRRPKRRKHDPTVRTTPRTPRTHRVPVADGLPGHRHLQ